MASKKSHGCQQLLPKNGLVCITRGLLVFVLVLKIDLSRVRNGGDGNYMEGPCPVESHCFRHVWGARNVMKIQKTRCSF